VERRRTTTTPRSGTTSSGRWWAVAIVVVAAMLGLFVGWTAYGLGHLSEATPRLVAGWVVVACGLVGWSQAPWSRVGPLLISAGFLWFTGEFSACLNVEPFSHRCVDTGSVVRTGAGLAGWLWLGVLAHAAASLPDGRVRTWPRRFVVVAGYVVAVAVAVRPLVIAVPLPLLALAVALVAITILLGLLPTVAQRATLTPDQAVGLGGALADALGDPGLRIAFHDGDRERWLDPTGRAVSRPTPEPGQTETLVEFGGAPMAIVTHDPATLAEPAVRAAVVMAVQLAAHNAQLRGDLDAQLNAIADSRRRLVTAGLRERQALGAQVGREVEAPLAALAGEFDGLGAVGDHLDRVREEIALARTEIHDLALGLYPARLVADGIAGALADLAARSSSQVAVAVRGAPRPEPGIEAAIAFLCAEVLTNAARHAPGARVRIDVTIGTDVTDVTIEDDGPGGATEAGGSGLRGLRDRVEALGGHLEMTSPPGMGTRLTATIPATREARPSS
jgi:signal transduction histidine kinase